MTGRELAEMFMFHQMRKPSNERMTIDQAERMIMAFAHDYHESEVKKLNLHVVINQVCDHYPDECTHKQEPITPCNKNGDCVFKQTCL